MVLQGTVCIIGNQILLGDSLSPAVVIVKNGKIMEIHAHTTNHSQFCNCNNVIDCGDFFVLPGIVDSHVHVNEPGRTDWEGFWTATRSAAAGGITTLIDMPLNSIPPTTSSENLLEKHQSAEGKCHVDVGFWGGVIPDNQGMLQNLVDDGVVGFKCFLTDSGVPEFPAVTEDQADEAMTKLKGTESVLAFHAEVTVDDLKDETLDPTDYQTFLKSRPSQMEQDAIQLVSRLCRKQRDVRCHIVHLSTARALDIIAELKSEGLPLTVETCPHYLTLNAEDVPDKKTTYKCCPPIRDLENQNLLWNGLKNKLIDMIVSDHSPCTAELKNPGVGDFMSAWGGISSVQFGLPLIWTEARKRGFTIADISRLMTQNPAKLVGIAETKGLIKTGFDADLVVFDPDAEIKIEESTILHKNKLTPYEGKVVYGKIIKTILRGHVIYNDGVFGDPIGEFIVPNALEAKIYSLVQSKPLHVIG